MSEEKLLGRICYKIAGREGKRAAVIVNVLGNNFVEIDGQVKRRRCNLSHLELTNTQLKIKKNISTDELKSLLKEQGIEVSYTKKPGVKKPMKQNPEKEPKAAQEEKKPKPKTKAKRK